VSEVGSEGTVSDDQATISLGIRLREVRGALGLTASKMAALWNLERKTWERYEHGDGLPKANVLVDLAERGFSEVWLLTGKGDMYASAPSVTAGDPAATRVAIYNVAYLLAQESPKINLDPKDFALTFQDLFDQLQQQEEVQDEQVASLAVQRLLREGGG
jgi:transcriptional regulator with XRE-family HTH domain